MLQALPLAPRTSRPERHAVGIGKSPMILRIGTGKLRTSSRDRQDLVVPCQRWILHKVNHFNVDTGPFDMSAADLLEVGDGRE